MELEQTLNKCQQRKLTPENKILPSLLLGGIESVTFQSHVQHSTNLSYPNPFPFPVHWELTKVHRQMWVYEEWWCEGTPKTQTTAWSDVLHKSALILEYVTSNPLAKHKLWSGAFLSSSCLLFFSLKLPSFRHSTYTAIQKISFQRTVYCKCQINVTHEQTIFNKAMPATC